MKKNSKRKNMCWIKKFIQKNFYLQKKIWNFVWNWKIKKQAKNLFVKTGKFFFFCYEIQ